MIGYYIIGIALFSIIIDRRELYFVKGRRREINAANIRLFLALPLLFAAFFCEEDWQKYAMLGIIFYKVYYILTVIYDNGYAIVVDNLRVKGSFTNSTMAVYGKDHVIRVTTHNYKKMLRAVKKEGSNVRTVKLGFHNMNDEQIINSAR
jgi:hypothetical protein